MKKNKNYNTTDIDPLAIFEKHIFHRDYFAHFLRWTHILKEAKIGETIVDFGCGQGYLLEVFWRNRFKQNKYTGLDIRQNIVDENKTKFDKIEWAEFICEDLVSPIYGTDFSKFQADKVCSFEVLEHIGKQNAEKFLLNFLNCGKRDAIYYLSTPNYSESVGAAGNHTYDSGDGRGKDVQEFEHFELEKILLKFFDIKEKFGTFASQKDYKHLLEDWQIKMFEGLNRYYDNNLVSNMMAPFFPEHSRNTIWVLKQKTI